MNPFRGALSICGGIVLVLACAGCGAVPVARGKSGAAAAPPRAASPPIRRGRVRGTETRAALLPRIRPAPPQLVLDPPMLQTEHENTVRLQGRVLRARGSARVAVFADATSGEPIASAYATVHPDGTFQADLNLGRAPSGLDSFLLGARYPGAAPQSRSEFLQIYRRSQLWPGPVAAAVRWAATRTTTCRVLAPTWLPQNLSPNPSAVPYVSAEVAAKSFTYFLQLMGTSTPYPVNSPKIDASQDMIAQISGSSFPSPSAALAHTLLPVPVPTAPATAVPLGQGSIGYLYTGTRDLVRWHEGLWTIEVKGPDAAEAIQTARLVVQDLRVFFLPPTHGVVVVRDIGGTPYTNVSYVQGADGYSIQTIGHATQALHLAASMRGGTGVVTMSPVP